MIFPRDKTEPLRSSMPFVVSGWIHGFLLACVALSPARGPAPRSLYEQEIQPHEKRIIWYSLRDRLPDISPAASRKGPGPPRAREKFDQTIVAGAKDIRGPKQFISMPAPEIKTPDPLPLPNIVGVSPPPRPIKPFVAPAEKRVTPLVAPLPEAPRVAAPKVEARTVPFADRVPKPTPREFKPPPLVHPKPADHTALPEAPSVTAAVEKKDLPLAIVPPRAPRKAFTPPASRSKAAPSPDALPEAPGVTAKIAATNLPVAIPNPQTPVRAFTPPPASQPKTTPAADIPAAPEVSGAASSGPSDVALAIVGIHPAKVPDFPTPPGSRRAGFSAGPEPRPNDRDAGSGGNSTIVVPGLLVRGGGTDNQPTLVANASPNSRESLLAAARAALGKAAGTPSAPAAPRATQVSSSPDPRLDGRAVYTIAIQMPNVTSYSGSWMVWFADREPETGTPSHDIRPPVPLRKVDPKYVAAAAAEKVEGIVRLFAVIRKDGHVESVGVARHLDDRLDRSAQEALAQWVFQPALLDGTPIDVDAVFEIPFRLAPKTDR